MGRRGFSVGLLPILGAKPATMKRVRTLVQEALRDVWGMLLDPVFAEHARGWTAVGESSLIRIGDYDEDRQVPSAISFMFYSSMDWAIDVAEHWLPLALSLGRRDFELALAKGGLRIDPARWPNALADDDARFLQIDNRLARIEVDEEDEKEEQLRWRMEPGATSSSPSRPLKELPPSLQEDIAAFRRRDVCACNLCRRRPRRDAWVATEGFVVEPVHAFRGALDLVANVGGALLLVVDGGWQQKAWAQQQQSPSSSSPPPSSSFATIEGLSSARRSLLHFAKDVATFGPASATTTPVVVTSSDGGRTWGEEVERPAFTVDGKRPDHLACVQSRAGEAGLWAVGAAKKKKATRQLLFASDGCSFVSRAVAGLDSVGALSCSASELVVVGGSQLARSRDGVAFTLQPLPAPAGGFAVSGARWWLEAGDALWSSGDEGATWSVAARRTTATVSTRVFGDPVHAGAALLDVNGLVLRVRPHAAPART